MKPKKLSIIACAALMTLTACSDRQMQGTMMGGSLGAIFGSSIGGLLNGPRGSDAGTALGMAVGAVVGNAVTSTKNRERTSNIDECDDSQNYPSSQRPIQGSATSFQSSNIDGLKIENIRFVDENRNQEINAGEKAKILFEIHNGGNSTLFNITPVITSSDPKKVMVSPTAIIGNLEPGKAVSYTANVLASPKLKNGTATFRIAFQDGKRLVTFKEFTLNTRAAK